MKNKEEKRKNKHGFSKGMGIATFVGGLFVAWAIKSYGGILSAGMGTIGTIMGYVMLAFSLG